jgi:hypothetical protein
MRRPLQLACGLLALVTATSAGQAMAATGKVTGTGSAAKSAVPIVAQSKPVLTGRGVTLITGDSVRLAKDSRGRSVVQGIPAIRSGAGAAFQTAVSSTHAYVIPASAKPYLNRFLDPGLFDVATLTSAGAYTKIPVRITFTGSTAPSVPGVTVTSTAAGAASGYLTPATAKKFGAALAAQYTADAKAHFPARTTLFGATGIRAGFAVTPGVTPKYPMRTLIIKVLDRGGAPVPFGLVFVSNSDSFAKFLDIGFVANGEARVSVPLGTYAVDTGVDVTDAAGNLTGFGLVTVGDYKVSTQNQTVTLDGRTATSPLSVRTPQPGDQNSAEIDLFRTDAVGTGLFSSGYTMVGPGSLFVSPAGATTVGTLSSGASWTLTGTPATGAPYAYSLAFPARAGIPADQAYSVTAGQLSTVNSRLYVDRVPRDGQMLIGPFSPSLMVGGTWSFPVQLPGNHVEYVNDVPGAAWLSSVFASPDPNTNPFAGGVDDAPRLAPAGATRSADWLRGPYLPNVPVETDGYSALAAWGGFDCPACRTADTIGVGLNFATDSTPGHSLETWGNLDGTPVAHVKVYRNGTLLTDQPDTGYAAVTVPAGTATYTIVDEVDRVPSLALQSTSTTTELTFVSTEGQGGTLPSSWTCSLGTGCTVLPLLKASVTLPVGLTGSVPIGTSTIELGLDHIAGAPASKITSGLVEIRRPGGAWQALPTTTAGGVHRATLTTTSADAGAAFDLRITGTDASGGKIVQTAIAAFNVSAS